MKKPISTKTHGIIDYVHAASFLALPRLVRMDPSISKLMTGAGIFTALYSMLTRYELGVFKVLPMKGHLALDTVQSAALAAAPFTFASSSKKSLSVPLLMGVSLVESLIVMNTQTKPKRRFLWFKV